jgi:putative ABC transport system permease protein
MTQRLEDAMRQAERLIGEGRWAVRNLRARGWRAAITVGLLAVALAANALLFATADSLIFRRMPYFDAERLLYIGFQDPATGRPTGGFDTPAGLDEWRKQTDLFAAVHARLSKVIFLTGAGEPELVQAADVTPGLIDMLGVRPRWGQSLLEGDELRRDVHVVLLAESLARERFGDPARAVGQTIETTAEPLLVRGVMPDSFRFPSTTQRIWRALDPYGPLAANHGLTLMARLAPGMPFETASELMAARTGDVGRTIGARAEGVAVPRPLLSGPVGEERRRMLWLLMGAGLCLLLIACANVASLELASAVGRVRTYAVHLAIGASHGALARTAMLEGAVLVGAAALAGAVLAYAGAPVLVEYFPPSLVAGSANPVAIDVRALLFMAGLAAVTWALATIPVLAFAWRVNLLDVLRLEGQASSGSRGSTVVRRGLTVAQIGLAVLLLVGSVVYVRSYQGLLALDKGFDSRGVAAITITLPPQVLATTDRREVARQILERVRALPGVIAAFEGFPPPSTGDSPTFTGQLEVDDRPPVETELRFPRLWVEPDYFTVLRIPLVEGRMLEPTDPPDQVLVTEALTRRLWPGQTAVGRRFRETPSLPWKHVVGVVGHVRTTYDDVVSGPAQHYQIYSAMPPPPPSRPAPAGRPSAGAMYSLVTVTARVDSRARAAALYEAARSVDPRNMLRVEFVDDQYARQFADRRLAATIVGGFGTLAFIVALAGIYGLMAFLVAERRREIGIRLALGADGPAVRRLVLGSALRLALAGAVLGIGATVAAARWAESQLFGISATDPLTIAVVTLAVLAAALLATWHPARQAGRVDPTVLLRN